MKMVLKKIVSFILLLCFTFCTVSVFACNSQSVIKKNQCFNPLKTKSTDLSMYAELEEAGQAMLEALKSKKIWLPISAFYLYFKIFC